MCLFFFTWPGLIASSLCYLRNLYFSHGYWISYKQKERSKGKKRRPKNTAFSKIHWREFFFNLEFKFMTGAPRDRDFSENGGCGKSWKSWFLGFMNTVFNAWFFIYINFLWVFKSLLITRISWLEWWVKLENKKNPKTLETHPQNIQETWNLQKKKKEKNGSKQMKNCWFFFCFEFFSF